MATKFVLFEETELNKELEKKLIKMGYQASILKLTDLELSEFSNNNLSTNTLNLLENKDTSLSLEEAQEKENYFKNIISHCTDLIRVIDKEGTILFCSESVKKLLGYAPSEVVGESIFNFIDDQDIELAKLHFHNLLRNKMLPTLEVRWKHKNGKVVLFETVGSKSITFNKQIQYILTCRDISERKKIETQLKQKNFELDSFVYHASHDFKAPLKSALGLIDLLKSTSDVDERKLLVSKLENSINKLDNFIDDLTSFTKNNLLPISDSPIDFQEILNTCLKSIDHMLNTNRLKVEMFIESTNAFYSDETRLKIIFQNIISNSIKYQRTYIEDSKLNISVTIDKKEAIIKFVDNGQGIRKEFLNKIFNMFYRATVQSFGSGLGLYIVKQSISKLGGKILNVESEIGEGTSITICLPNLKK